MKSLAGVPQESMSIAIGYAACGLSIDGRYDITLTDTFLRRFAARVHLRGRERERAHHTSRRLTPKWS
jgi:hypothetical protein